ncbi:MAG: PAS domain S-box protein [Candidatus Cloacimonetes bacterium]|nr:PAS domain S-box protein [Candidatus Cloacimonadota bacterium]
MRKKINLGFIIIILLVWIICLYTIFSSLSVQKLFNELNDDIVPGAIAMVKMKYEASDIRSWTLTYILRGNVVRNEKTIKEWLQEDWLDLENATQIHYEHEKHIGIEDQQAAEEIIKLSQKLISASIEIIDLKDQGVESDILFEKIKEDFRSAFYPLKEALDKHIAIHNEELTAARIKAQSKYQATLLYIAILGIIVTLLTIFIGLFIHKIFTRYITERNKAEKALKESEEKYRSITNNVNLGIYRSTAAPEDLFVEVNPAIVSIFGYKNKENFMKTNVSKLYQNPSDRKKFSEKIMKNGFIKDEELQLKKKDGTIFIASVSAVAVKDIEGNIKYYDGIIEDITERKQIEQALKESEEKYKELIHNQGEGFGVVDTDEQFKFANPAAENIFGVQSGKLVGRNIKDFVSSEQLKLVQKETQKRAKGKKSVYELEIIRPDKEIRNVLVTATPHFDSEKKLIEVFAVFRDITERKKAEKQLKFLSSFVEQSSEGMAIADLEGRLLYVNNTWVQMHGYESIGDLIGNHLKIFHNQEQLEKDVKPFNQKAKENGFNTGEVGHIRKDGTPFPTMMTTTVIKDDQGKPIAIAGIAKDITLQKKAEEALKENEEKFRTFMETANDLMQITDKDGKFTYVNESMINKLEYSKEELIEKHISQILTKEAFEKDFKPNWEKFIVEGEMSLETTFVTKNRKEIHGELKAVAIYDSDGKFTGSRAVFHDLTVRKKMEEEINRHREQLKLINTILRHDLANNLAVIKSAIKIFKVRKDESILDEASLNVDKSSELIHKMREHENLITKESLKVFEISEVIKQVMENYPDIEFAIKGKKEIFADDALNSVIDNIFRNAVVHGRTNRIDIEIGAYKDRCYVRIADNGTGIPDKIKEKIFDEGFKYGKKAHTGMGLHIVKESVKKWGGSIFVEDNKPKGAVFVLILRSVR